MFKTKAIWGCFVGVPIEIKVPVTFSFVRHSDLSVPLTVFTVPPGGSFRWKARPGHELIELPSSRIRILADPDIDAGLGTTLHVDVTYVFPDDPSPLHATEYWGKWQEITDPVPIGDYIKGIATKSMIEYDGKRYKHGNFGRVQAEAHFTADIERLSCYLAEHNSNG